MLAFQQGKKNPDCFHSLAHFGIIEGQIQSSSVRKMSPEKLKLFCC